MFGKLKDKLKSALSVFTKKAEEEVGITPEEKVAEKIVEKKIVEQPVIEREVIKDKITDKKAAEVKPVQKKEASNTKTKDITPSHHGSKIEKKKKDISVAKERPVEKAIEKDIPVKIKEEPKINHPTPVVEELKEEEPKEDKLPEDKPQEEKKGFFSKIFGKKEDKKEEPAPEKVKEIPVPEQFNPATQKYEPDLAQIKEISAEKEKIEEEISEIVTEETREEVKIEVTEEKKSFFGKVKQAFTTKTISAEKFEDLFWDLELALLENNVSVEVIEKIKEDLKTELVDKPLPRDIESVIESTLKRTLHEILSYEKIDILKKIKNKSKKPYVIAFFGVNGAGKTTSIAKLTYYLQQQGLSVVLAACDTFRAAAIQQLEEHADKLGVKMIKHDYGSDAAAVAYDAVKYAEKANVDVVLIDTAGRLHSNTNLMAELEKIIRVTKPDLKIFVGESITGNDCIEQARQFNSLVEMDGAILTKADVDEKGGAPLSIAYTIKKPILFLGMGQEYKDLEEFDAEKIMQRLGL